MTNNFTATCGKCGKPVAPGTGVLHGRNSKGHWNVSHVEPEFVRDDSTVVSCPK